MDKQDIGNQQLAEVKAALEKVKDQVFALEQLLFKIMTAASHTDG